MPGAPPSAGQVLRDTALQEIILRNGCSHQDYTNLRLALRGIALLSDRMRCRIFNQPCQETIPATATHARRFCRQDNDAPDANFVVVRKCKGNMVYSMRSSVEAPVMNPVGDWPAPTILRAHNPHNINPQLVTDYYVCQNCINRDIGQRWTDLNNVLQNGHQANHCTTHNWHFNLDNATRRKRNCTCHDILTERTNCRDCRNAPHAMLESRARKWYMQLKRTHRKKVKGRNQTRSTYIGNFRQRAVCPVEGCGRMSQTKEDDPALMKTCLGCCGVFRANPHLPEPRKRRKKGRR